MTNKLSKALEPKLKMALQGPALIHIGKRGLTESLIQEITNQLELNEVVKVKILKSVEDPKSALNDLATACHAILWKQIGRVGVFYEKE
jgi:RNA-binding protein YhbY